MLIKKKKTKKTKRYQYIFKKTKNKSIKMQKWMCKRNKTKKQCNQINIKLFKIYVKINISFETSSQTNLFFFQDVKPN